VSAIHAPDFRETFSLCLAGTTTPTTKLPHGSLNYHLQHPVRRPAFSSPLVSPFISFSSIHDQFYLGMIGSSIWDGR
jgi:hypothetical protein